MSGPSVGGTTIVDVTVADRDAARSFRVPEGWNVVTLDGGRPGAPDATPGDASVLLPPIAPFAADGGGVDRCVGWLDSALSRAVAGGVRRVVCIVDSEGVSGVSAATPGHMAVLGWARREGRRLARFGVNVNAVALSGSRWVSNPAEAWEEAVGPVAFLCAEAASYVSGVVLRVESPRPDASGRADSRSPLIPDGVVWVTGGATGLGLATCRRLSRAGWTVVSSVHRSSAGEFPEYRCDVTDAGGVEEVADRIRADFGPISALVACAGGGVRSLAVRTPPEVFAEVVSLNLLGSFHCLRSVLQPMLMARTGAVVFVSSAVAAVGLGGMSAYGAAKGGLHSLAASAAREAAGRGVTVNVVAPGLLANAASGMPADLVEGWCADTPAGRVGEVDEAAAAIEFLVSRGGMGVTGQVLAVDGGYGTAS